MEHGKGLNVLMADSKANAPLPSPPGREVSETADIDLSWFKGLTKTKVAIGFESYSPNSYYKGGRVTAVFTADSYHYCDNDSCNEVAFSVITNKPGNSNLGPLTLIGKG